ncbi:BZ3500_MvSof-1268-A1-R1_Chr11-2g03378 [Microbotryum saponariae]|uniref:BZ3500_MvSof-1268-A1-R1_Chr11-2g03378 protein n=1 Tax=Microbotryum saponariae TaxID=289078 RepID=A0A2X0KN95_9BASI|nr:BZ3500_MvSof-1268-A1-R1_Chr11-2g03378 [Microbotryum saponariae]SDA03239.1 BZ3501_MvSof-1269-A2-R1_Chr11g02949 [Microbotryum saponariae]
MNNLAAVLFGLCCKDLKRRSSSRARTSPLLSPFTSQLAKPLTEFSITPLFHKIRGKVNSDGGVPINKDVTPALTRNITRGCLADVNLVIYHTDACLRNAEDTGAEVGFWLVSTGELLAVIRSSRPVRLVIIGGLKIWRWAAKRATPLPFSPVDYALDAGLSVQLSRAELWVSSTAAYQDHDKPLCPPTRVKIDEYSVIVHLPCHKADRRLINDSRTLSSYSLRGMATIPP